MATAAQGEAECVGVSEHCSNRADVPNHWLCCANDVRFVEAIGSLACIPQRACDHDIPVFWSIAVVVELVVAVVQLTLVSNVYSFKLATMTTSMGGVTSSRIKIMVYYAQVRPIVPWQCMGVGVLIICVLYC